MINSLRYADDTTLIATCRGPKADLVDLMHNGPHREREGGASSKLDNSCLRKCKKWKKN